jgi:hypothetical protein
MTTAPLPFSTDADALNEAQRHEENWRPNANLIVRGQASDQERAGPHDHHRCHKHCFAADAIAEVTNNCATDGTGNKSNSVCA